MARSSLQLAALAQFEYLYMVVATPASVQEGGALDSGREVSFATSLDLRYISANAAAQLSS